MKKYNFFVSMVMAGSLLVTGCGPFDSNGNGTPPFVDTNDSNGNGTPPIGETDQIAPVITVLGDNPVNVLQNETYTDAGATATDDVDGTVAVTTSGSVDTSTLGAYTITYAATDSAGNTATATRTVNVVAAIVDSMPVLIYDSPTVITVDSTFDPLEGVTAHDAEDGVLTDEIVIVSNDVNTSEIGDYSITYSVTDSADNRSTGVRIVKVIAEIVPPEETSSGITGTALDCGTSDTNGSTDANETVATEPFKKNISSETVDLESRRLQTSHNTIDRLDMVMPETKADGSVVDLNVKYHPIAVSYLEHVVGSDYEMGDGSADIGDPDNLDKVMVSLSRDNGQTWKDYPISDSSKKSSIKVVWNGETIDYPGDAQKPTMAINGNHILVAWNDKYCPSGNPLDLPETVVDPDTNKTTYPTDSLSVNGPQGFVDYLGIVAPNGKTVYQVPFSCVWTARGVIDGTTGDITWHAPMQLTTGTRDSNHIWVEGSDAGFAMTWQEDVAGLKAGEGEGPGEGWSGATGTRGTDIWYTSIKATDFEATGELVDGKPKSANNFHYPVRITDNEQCQSTDKKLYCNYFCSSYGSVTSPKGNDSGETVTRCLTYDTDMLTDTIAILDGDTGASRPALKILKTNNTVENEYVVVLGYEETKALKEKVSGEGDQDQGEVPTDIAVEGKAVYFESFDFSAIDAFDESNISTIQNTPMPIVSAGNIINVKSPRAEDTTEMIYENARRLVIGTQVDACDASGDDDITFAILYKQSFEVQGASSDMFVRTWRGFNYADKVPLNGLDVSNVSAQELTTTDNPAEYAVSWSADNLDDYTYENGRENTFSPRISLRGENIYVGFEYTPYETMDGEQLPGGGLFPSNFHTNIYTGGSWAGPVNITQVIDSSTSTVDARFFTTPKGSYDVTGLESDKSNPNVLFVTWGTIVKGTEADLFFKRSTDNGATWEEERSLSSISRTIIEEKEVESFASPDGKHIYNAWLQQSEALPSDTNITTGLDSWFGRVDYNTTIVPAP